MYLEVRTVKETIHEFSGLVWVKQEHEGARKGTKGHEKARNPGPLLLGRRWCAEGRE